jgi:exoribonuclease-2
VGTAPGRHAGLGLEAYVQVTSALRRYQDLATQRQVAALVSGTSPPYDREAMLRLAAATERAEVDARRAERTSNEYWMLRYLESQVGHEIEALVVDLDPRPIVQLVETLWEQPVAALTGADTGERVRLHVERVNPRAGILALRP